MDFIAQYPELYKCHTFTQFFQDSVNQSEVCKFTISAHRTPYLAINDLKDSTENTEDKNLERKCNDTDLIVQTCEHDIKPAVKDVNKDYTRFLTPMASIESDDSDYIYEAALEFSHAVQAEANLEYEEAHVRYKRGVEILLNGSKGDMNDDRKFIAKAKIAKYLARADEIFDKFLSIESAEHADKTNFKLTLDTLDETDSPTNGRSVTFFEQPWNHLTKYKVLQILSDRVMQVQCVTEPQRTIYVMKGIEKPSSNAPSQTIFLPQQVPYMVQLLGYFQSENKIFLLLKTAEGGLLYDYIKQYTASMKTNVEMNDIFPEIKNANNNNNNKEDAAKTEIPEVMSIPTNKCAFRQLPEVCLKQWARELAVAIHSLHSKGIILGDLHMENLLLGAHGQLVLSYFYQHESTEIHVIEPVLKALSSTALQGHFVAPERPLTLSSDWWSYGIILYQLLIGVPFKYMHPGYIEIYGCVQYPLEIELSESARSLLDNLIQQWPENRLNYEQLQKHEFFAGTNWQEIEQNCFKKTKS